MNNTDKTAKLAQYHSHKNVSMAGYESYMDQQYPELIAPKHAMRMDELPWFVRLKHMTAGEVVKLVLKIIIKFVLGIIVIESIGIVLFLLQDISRYGLFG
jgi:hypothetical protein